MFYEYNFKSLHIVDIFFKDWKEIYQNINHDFLCVENVCEGCFPFYFSVFPTMNVYYDILLSENNAKVKEEKPAWIAIYAISILQYTQQFGPMRAKTTLFE